MADILTFPHQADAETRVVITSQPGGGWTCSVHPRTDAVPDTFYQHLNFLACDQINALRNILAVTSHKDLTGYPIVAWPDEPDGPAAA